MLKTLAIILAFNINLNYSQISKEFPDFILSDSLARHARLRCLQQYPLADAHNYSDTADTHCFLQCLLYRMALMNLSTRGFDSNKFMDIWERIDQPFIEDACMENFNFSESLTGYCSDCYRKLMEFREKCLELFEYIFSPNSSWKSEESNYSKKIGESATEFCDSLDGDYSSSKENLEEKDVTLLSHYKDKLKCIFKNIHYLDGYGRVDESEVVLSYQEAREDSVESRSIISICSHRANSKYQENNYGGMALELEKCLKSQSLAYAKVYKLRDETSRQY